MFKNFKDGEVTQKHKENRGINFTIRPKGLSVLMSKSHLNKWCYMDHTISISSVVLARNGQDSLESNPSVSFYSIT